MAKKRPNYHPELGLPEVRKLWLTEGLFSDHYLKARIQKNNWWPTDEQARPLWQFCKELYDKRYLACAKNNEAFTRQELIDKILEKLGFAWTDNLSLPDQDAEPDYILFTNTAEKEAVIEKGKAQRYRAAVALQEAKKLNHPLSQRSKHQQRYPHQQIRDYLSEAEALTWGILTNGNEWRLYCRDAKASQFFGLNFEVAIKSLEDFKYFLALFSPKAFARDSQTGRCRLDDVRDRAAETQLALEEDLRQRIFTTVETLANGFKERSENQIGDTEQDLRALYNNCLIFLYRLLFILYAEGRDLLPVDRPNRKYYKQLSLRRLIPAVKGFTEFDNRTRTRLYQDIRELCNLINGTDESKNKEYSVPRYNGGLFDPDRYPLLEKWAVSDAVLAAVLRDLLFAKPGKEGQELPLETVDYADLRVQQLGSIYEGLLEHHFARNKDGRLQRLAAVGYALMREHHFARNKDGRLALTTDKAERKATGTYYTPDYIVKYIVENTLGPLIAEIEQRPEVKAGKENSFAAEVLKLNICDPAMGSGHFLVEATAYLAEHIVYHPTTQFQAKFEKGESQEQAEIAYWRRRVVEACIYGVDLNPLAVELAKLSLWLTTIATDQPLNFLDHHLRCGNSLIGARLDQLGSVPAKKGRASRLAGLGAPQQVEFTFGPDFKRVVSEAIRQIHGIEAESSRDVSTVKGKEKRWLETVLPALAPYKGIADLWTSTYFGQPLDNETYVAKAQRLLAGNGGPRSVVAASGTTDATKRVPPSDNWRATASDRHFFHWELEFPEVFFGEDGSPKDNPGFDAVIGNPPYVSFGLGRTDTLDISLRAYYEGQYTDSAEYKISLYALFMQRATDLLRASGGAGLILPDSFLTGRYFSKIRRCLVTMAAIRRAIRFSKDFWGSGDVGFPVVLVWFRMPRGWGCEQSVVDFAECDAPEDLFSPTLQYSHERQTAWANAFRNRFRLIPNPADRSAISRIERESVPLGEIINMHHGIRSKVGRDKVVSDHSKGDTWKAGLIGSDEIQRYSLWWEGNYLNVEPELLFHGGWDAQHIEQPKLLIRRTGDRIIAAHDATGLYHTNALIYGIPNQPRSHRHDLLVILTIINSRLFEYYYQKVSMKKGRTLPQVEIDTLEQLPIHDFSFTTPPSERERQVAKARELYERCLAKNDAGDALEFVEKQLHEKPAPTQAGRTDVIHDLLAFLAERMIALNKDKQTATRKFLTDLKDFHGIDARSLTPKTKLDEFWKLQVGDVFAHFRANKLRLKEAHEEKIRTRFQKAKDKLVPLEAQLAFTDALIDQIVYRLYGLTEDEIKLVESGFAEPTADRERAKR